MGRYDEYIKATWGLSANAGQRVINFISVYWSINPMQSFVAEERPPSRNGLPMPLPKEQQQQMRQLISSMLVPARELSWIKKDARQLNWIAFRINGLFPIKQFGTIEKIIGKDKIIAQIDACSLEKEIKIKNLKVMHDAWKNTQAEDKIMNRLKGNDEKLKCQLVMEWIKKKKPNLLPNKALNNANDVILHFDRIEFVEIDKKSCMNSIMGAYNKKVSRSKKQGEKQCCISLPLKTLDQLNRMVENEKSSQAELIKNLIEKEWVVRSRRPDLYG
jgi:hypothetical protein